MRMPNFPTRPMWPILTVQQHLDAGIEITSHCSAFPGTRQHAVDLQAALLVYNADVDYEWKRSQICPECGAPGGGISLTFADPVDRLPTK